MNETPDNRIKCPFCGFEFDTAAGTGYCGSCPLAKNCKLLRCPNCAYEMPAEPKLFTMIRKLRRKQ